MGFMMIGFFKPVIPQYKPGDKLLPVPSIDIQTADGKAINLQQLKGKVVFINFWATWCPPCLAELPSINKLYRKVKDNPNIVFITVDIDNNLAKSSQFIRDKGYSFSVYGGDGNGNLAKLNEDGIPVTLVIDKQGNIVYDHGNRANYDDDKFEQFITGLSMQ
jgi:thiol-disulfide isomerase/thioredoxin